MKRRMRWGIYGKKGELVHPEFFDSHKDADIARILLCDELNDKVVRVATYS